MYALCILYYTEEAFYHNLCVKCIVYVQCHVCEM